MIHQLGSVVLQLWPHIQTLRDNINEALADGQGLSASEADALGLALSRECGDLQIRVNGRDILRKPAQELLFRGCSRVLRQLAVSVQR